MRASLTLGRDVVWARRVRRMVGLSTVVHVGLFAVAALFGAWMAAHRPVPMMAYSVELTDMPGTGGQLPAGPGKGIIGRSPEAPSATRNPSPPAPAAPVAPAPAPAAAAPLATAPPKPPEPAPPAAKVETPAVKEPPAPPVVAKKVEPKPVDPAPVAPKKAEPKKVEPKPAPKAEAKPAPKPEPKPESKPAPKPEAKPVAKAEPAQEPAKPAAAQQASTASQAKPAAPGNAAPPTAAKPGAATDEYAAAAERFRRMAAVGSGAGAPGAGVAGGGPGGGVLGEGGDGRGGGQIRSLEYVAYLQRVRNAVQERWASAISQPGLIAAVRFQIAPDGTVSNVRLEQSSGNAVYDQTALAAVQRVGKLPPPPAAYVNDFREFQVNFRGSEVGGMDG